MDIDWSQLRREGRWNALAMIWNAILMNVAGHWWFGPLVLVLLRPEGKASSVLPDTSLGRFSIPDRPSKLCPEAALAPLRNDAFGIQHIVSPGRPQDLRDLLLASG
jgi:hypothetical protein